LRWEVIVNEIEVGKLITGITYEQYHNFGLQKKALRSSHLKDLKQSPAHFKYALNNHREETEALRQGKLIHSAFENPEKFMDSYVVEPIFEGRTQKGELTTSSNCKEVKEKRAEWLSNQKKEVIILSEKDSEMIVGMINAVSKHKLASRLLKQGIREVSGFVEDPDTGVILQYRPDFIHEFGYIIDIKSTRNASVSSFTHDIFSDRGLWYLIQACHYAYCAKLMGHAKHNSFTFIAVEKTPPYGLNVISLSEHHLDSGEGWRRKLTKLYADCLKSGVWPGYEEKAINPEIPQYVSPPNFGDDFYE
jgi:hypothetical protein